MILPDPIRNYFDADTVDDSDKLIQAFTPDAAVIDEGATHRGHVAIAAWWRAAKARYQHSAEPFDAERQDGAITVRARVTGVFPGSPATLTYRFRLAGGRIASLEIGA